jgi:hypothetical protein
LVAGLRAAQEVLLGCVFDDTGVAHASGGQRRNRSVSGKYIAIG